MRAASAEEYRVSPNSTCVHFSLRDSFIHEMSMLRDFIVRERAHMDSLFPIESIFVEDMVGILRHYLISRGVVVLTLSLDFFVC